MKARHTPAPSGRVLPKVTADVSYLIDDIAACELIARAHMHFEPLNIKSVGTNDHLPSLSRSTFEFKMSAPKSILNVVMVGDASD